VLTRNQIINMFPHSFKSSRNMNVAAAEKLLLDIKEIFDRNGIRFWLFCGTFLGAYRDHCLMPWDEDIDLAIFKEDMEIIAKCQRQFEEKGIFFAPEPDAVLCRDNEHADLYTFLLESDKRVRINYRIDAIDFEILDTVYFLGQRWRILNNPEKWLYYIYGPNWRKSDQGLPAHMRFHANVKKIFTDQ